MIANVQSVENRPFQVSHYPSELPGFSDMTYARVPP